jgi:hypothetical protein
MSKRYLQKALAERFSHFNRLFFVGITPMLYLKFKKLHQTTQMRMGKSVTDKN